MALTPDQLEQLRSFCQTQDACRIMGAILVQMMVRANMGGELTPDQVEKLRSLCQTQNQCAFLEAILEQSMLINNNGGGGGGSGVQSITAGNNITLGGTASDPVINAVPSGTSGQFQYNNSGAFGGADGLSINGGVISAVTIVEAANTVGLSISGGLTNGAGTTAFASISGVWNTTGLVSAFPIAITETGTPTTGSRLFQVLGGAAGATERFAVACAVDGGGFRIENGHGMSTIGGSGFQMLIGNAGIAAFTTGSFQSYVPVIASNGQFGATFSISHNGTNGVIALSTGTLVFPTLPTSSAGLPSGALYTTAGAVMQV